MMTYELLCLSYLWILHTKLPPCNNPVYIHDSLHNLTMSFQQL